MGKYNVATIILAGGQGKRLYPLTMHHSKPAVSFGGRYRLIDVPISNSIHSDFREIFVIGQYLSDELEHHIGQTYHFGIFQSGSINFLTPEENEKGEKEWFEGTADAVRKKLPTLLKSSADYFLILSGDQLYNIDFQNMVDHAIAHQASLTIASLPVKEADAPRFGLLAVDEAGKIVRFQEKPQTAKELTPFLLTAPFYRRWGLPFQEKQYLASMGIYVIPREALVELLRKDQTTDFGDHLIPSLVAQRKATTYVYNGYWEDIGTVTSYYEANLALTTEKKGLNTYNEEKPIFARTTYLPGPRIRATQITRSIICEGCIIEAAEIEHCVVGLRSHIKQGTILRHTVMLGNHFYLPPTHNDRPLQHEFWIGENCLIEKAIIDEHVRIGNHVRLTNAQGLSHYDGAGIYIREGIIIVTAGTHLPDHFTL